MKQIKKYIDQTLFYGVIVRKNLIRKPDLITSEMVIGNQGEWYPKVEESPDYIALKAGSSTSDIAKLIDTLQIITTLRENLSIEVMFDFTKEDHNLAISPALTEKWPNEDYIEITLKFDLLLNPNFSSNQIKIPGRFKNIPELEWPFTIEVLEKFDKENNELLGKFITENNIR